MLWIIGLLAVLVAVALFGASATLGAISAIVGVIVLTVGGALLWVSVEWDATDKATVALMAAALVVWWVVSSIRDSRPR